LANGAESVHEGAGGKAGNREGEQSKFTAHIDFPSAKVDRKFSVLEI